MSSYSSSTSSTIRTILLMLSLLSHAVHNNEAFTHHQIHSLRPSSQVLIMKADAGISSSSSNDGPLRNHQVQTRRRFWQSTMSSVMSVGLVGSTFIPASNAKDPQGKAAGNSKIGGLANKIKGIVRNMDELQRDLMQERWDLVQAYPPQLRSYVPVFTTYTDAAFPTELPSDYGLRVALRYEVGRYFAALERLKRATARQSLDEAYLAYSDMSLHLDRYMRVGGLYTYYDSVIDNELFFTEYKDALVHSDPVKDPARVRDLIVLIKGPDSGKTGIVIGVYPDDTNGNCVVKLDKQRGMREIRVVPLAWAAKRVGEQDPDEVFLIPRKTTSIPL